MLAEALAQAAHYIRSVILGSCGAERAYSPGFQPWLDRLPLEVALAVSADMAYLLEYGRDAALPYVRHHVQSSAHFPNMSEVRTESQAEGRRWVIRVLAWFANRDQVVAFCVAGDKATWEARHPGEDWYEAHVPVADQVFNMMRKERGRQ